MKDMSDRSTRPTRPGHAYGHLLHSTISVRVSGEVTAFAEDQNGHIWAALVSPDHGEIQVDLDSVTDLDVPPELAWGRAPDLATRTNVYGVPERTPFDEIVRREVSQAYADEANTCETAPDVTPRPSVVEVYEFAARLLRDNRGTVEAGQVAHLAMSILASLTVDADGRAVSD